MQGVASAVSRAELVRKISILLSSNEIQQYAGLYLLQITVYVSGVYRTHHQQEYIKL